MSRPERVSWSPSERERASGFAYELGSAEVFQLDLKRG